MYTVFLGLYVDYSLDNLFPSSYSNFAISSPVIWTQGLEKCLFLKWGHLQDLVMLEIGLQRNGMKELWDIKTERELSVFSPALERFTACYIYYNSVIHMKLVNHFLLSWIKNNLIMDNTEINKANLLIWLRIMGWHYKFVIWKNCTFFQL